MRDAGKRMSHEELREAYVSLLTKHTILTEICYFARSGNRGIVPERIFTNLSLALDLPDATWERWSHETLGKIWQEIDCDTARFRLAHGIN